MVSYVFFIGCKGRTMFGIIEFFVQLLMRLWALPVGGSPRGNLPKSTKDRGWALCVNKTIKDGNQ